MYVMSAFQATESKCAVQYIRHFINIYLPLKNGNCRACQLGRLDFMIVLNRTLQFD